MDDPGDGFADFRSFPVICADFDVKTPPPKPESPET
jgi:hypothetical protein